MTDLLDLPAHTVDRLVSLHQELARRETETKDRRETETPPRPFS